MSTNAWNLTSRCFATLKKRSRKLHSLDITKVCRIEAWTDFHSWAPKEENKAESFCSSSFYRQHMAKHEGNSWLCEDLQTLTKEGRLLNAISNGGRNKCFTGAVCWWSTAANTFVCLLQHSETCFQRFHTSYNALNVSGTLWHRWSVVELRASGVVGGKTIKHIKSGI